MCKQSLPPDDLPIKPLEFCEGVLRSPAETAVPVRHQNENHGRRSAFLAGGDVKTTHRRRCWVFFFFSLRGVRKYVHESPTHLNSDSIKETDVKVTNISNDVSCFVHFFCIFWAVGSYSVGYVKATDVFFVVIKIGGA